MRKSPAPLIVAAFLLVSQPVSAEIFTNVLGNSADFPAGAISFADQVVDYSPGIVFDPVNNVDVPLPAYRGADNALGVPDVDIQAVIDCGAAPSVDNCNFVSLGVGGSLTVQFTDNLLTGSGNADADLWIFEAGPQEDTFVDISVDGFNWASVGVYASFALGVDIDAFGFDATDSFAFVRLRDDPAQGNTTGITVGADIDAIGAISTTVVPGPAAGWLFVSALGALAVRRRARRLA
ncbi:MAG: PEP-CTERM sorting domain-containing protein [Gammaproteobacteria bacterium]|nr:PEP-CTERM sorting domain-containing protein [Gammaproteobacteria bacterium]MBT8443420.1 PEP-CTERM sorting domain-containing protein [Gammaproteobacteria bacterium]NND35949.1 PEP-CTERM sorting domain-containing protein [Gammaproteobacteria bacterium]